MRKGADCCWIPVVALSLLPVLAGTTIGTGTVPEESNDIPTAGNWFAVNTTNAPAPRYGAGLAYDWVRSRMMLFGGTGANGSLNDTWTLDVATGRWSELTTNSPPQPSEGATMFDDYNNQTIILFGGPQRNQTWMFDGKKDAWEDLSPLARPPGRSNASVTYDVSTNRLILFGGCCLGSDRLNDLWEFWVGNRTWHQLPSTRLPPGRESAVLTSSSLLYLFGGRNDSSFLNDYWWYNYADANWTQIGPPGTVPTTRAATSLASEARFASDRNILFGGLEAGHVPMNDTWRLFGGTVSTSSAPLPRYGHSSSYDESSDRTVLFGGLGVGGVMLNDTWVFARDGVHPTRPGDPWYTSLGVQDVNSTHVSVWMNWSRPPDGGSPLTRIRLYLDVSGQSPCLEGTLYRNLPPDATGFNETVRNADFLHPHYSRGYVIAAENELGESPVKRCGRVLRTRPVLESYVPGDNAQGVERSSGVTLRFDRPMDLTAVALALTVEPATPFGMVKWNETVFLNFTARLAAATRYTIRIADTAADAHGTRLDKNYTVGFTTQPIPTGRVAGNVVDTRGEPIPETYIEAHAVAGGGVAASNRTSTDGFYSLILPSECSEVVCRYFIQATYPGGETERSEEFDLSSDRVVNFARRPRPSGFPGPELALPATGAAGGAFALALVIGGEAFHFAILMLLAAFYSRVKRDRVLDNFTRGRIYERIRAEPGISFTHLRRALSLANGTLVYHLYTLQREGLVQSRRDGRNRRFTPVGLSASTQGALLSSLQERILALVRFNPGISQTEISDRLASPRQTVNYNVACLVRKGLLNQEGWWRKQCFVVEKRLPSLLADPSG